MLRKLLLSFILSASLAASAYDFRYGGICYTITSYELRTVEVSPDWNKKYSGRVLIPATVLHERDRYTVTAIGSDAFRDCAHLRSVSIGDSVTYIGPFAFYGCTALDIVRPGVSVSFISDLAFKESGPWLDRNNWDDGILYLGPYLLATSSDILEECSVRPGTRLIVENAFAHRTDMTSVTLPESIRVIESAAFFCCTALTTVTIHATDPSEIQIPDDAFGGVPVGLCTLRVPAQSLSRYRDTSPWSDFGTIEPIEDGSRTIFIF